jgi:hypothetical protein
MWSGHSCPLAYSSKKPADKSSFGFDQDRSAPHKPSEVWRTTIGATGGKSMNAKRLQASSYVE